MAPDSKNEVDFAIQKNDQQTNSLSKAKNPKQSPGDVVIHNSGPVQETLKNLSINRSMQKPSLYRSPIIRNHPKAAHPRVSSAQSNLKQVANKSSNKYGKYKKLPKNFGYKKWGLRLPPKMLPVPKMVKRRPRKSDINVRKNASQKRYQAFLKRKFKLGKNMSDNIERKEI